MISPYVRRLRLATEVRALRAEAQLTADQLGRRIGRSRADISRLENGHVVDQADIISILDTLGVDGDRWNPDRDHRPGGGGAGLVGVQQDDG